MKIQAHIKGAQGIIECGMGNNTVQYFIRYSDG